MAKRKTSDESTPPRASRTTSRRVKKTSPRQSRSFFSKFKTLFARGRWKWTLGISAATVCAVIFAIYATWASFFDLKQLGVMGMLQRTYVYDCYGKPFSRLSGEDRVVVPISQVSPLFIKALLAREDSRFYKHLGIDPIGIARAIFKNLTHLSAREGASTITQQLARNSFPLGGRNLHRKLLEAFVAVRIERNLTKNKILESYVNRIYFGSGFYGVETASKAYFGKPSAKLTLSEAAILAGLIRSPERFSPFKNPEASLVQRDTVIKRMTDLEYITPTQAANAKAEMLNVADSRPPGTRQGYALDIVEQTLALVLDEDDIVDGGLKIYTSIDPELQKIAEEAVDAELTKIEQRPGYTHPKRADFSGKPGEGTPYLQGAVVVMDNATGGVRAVVGGRNFTESRYNRAFLSPRQVGSTFKPFVYASAYETGSIRPNTPVSDGPVRRGEIRNASNWSPENSDGQSRGVLSAEEGLIFSRNTMTVRIGDTAGVNTVCKTAEDAGLGQIPKFPSIYLGSFESTLKSMTAAYTIFPNQGIRRQPYLIERVEDAQGRILYHGGRIETRVLSPGVSNMVSRSLQQVLRRGTAASANIPFPAAGKTGTTNDYRDAWFIGYTRSLTCGVWVGLDKPETIMSRGYGAALALPIWSSVMTYAHNSSHPASPFQEQSSEAPNSDNRKNRPPLPQRILESFKNLFGR